MTIRTVAGNLVLDAGDFQYTYKGVSFGLKVSYTDSPAGTISALIIAEKQANGTWLSNDQSVIAMSFEQDIAAAGGVIPYITKVVLPKLNFWIQVRFAAAAPGPAPAPAGVPQVLIDLDAALRQLKVTTGADGLPVVSV